MDTDVVNGRTYYYAIVAYDFGLSPNGDITSGIPPSENNAIIELNENEYVISTGRNVQVVIPKAPSAGYTMDTLKIDDSKKTSQDWADELVLLLREVLRKNPIFTAEKIWRELNIEFWRHSLTELGF